MKKRNAHQLAIKFIWSIIIICLFFWWWNFAEIINTETLIWWIDAIEKASTDREKFDEMILHFCWAITKWNEDIYDSHQSLFVYYICKNQPNPNKVETYKLDPTFDQNKWFSENAKTSYTRFIEDDEGNKINELDINLPSMYYNTEDYIQTLFDIIIGSYTSIYQANVYGYINNPDKTIEENIHDNFANKYFKIDPEENTYIKFCATDDEKYKYPKTCKKLKEYFYGAWNLINSNEENYLNDKNIYKTYETNKESCTEKNSKNNIIPCWLYGWETKYFTKLVYNELMFYALFVDYYSYLLQNKSDFKNWDVIEFQKKLANNQNRIQDMINNIETSREAIQTTIKMLKEIQYTFPIHIGFLMYSEDIYKFTTSMNKTLTPIYTLHDILRNVQKTD